MECQCRVLVPVTDGIEQQACPRAGGALSRVIPLRHAAEERERIAALSQRSCGDASRGWVPDDPVARETRHVSADREALAWVDRDPAWIG
jgi:hypothetical protein